MFNTVATENSINTTVKNLATRNIEAVVVDTKNDALKMLKDLIPAGASVMNGSSTTLEEIGFIDLLKSGAHDWNNLHESIVKETDQSKQASSRQQAIHADYYLGSVHALVESGEFVVASNTGSQLPHIAYTSPNLIFIVGSQKIVPDLSKALERLEKYVVPLENERSLKAYGAPTNLNKLLIFKGENPYMGRKITLILVKEALGF